MSRFLGGLSIALLALFAWTATAAPPAEGEGAGAAETTPTADEVGEPDPSPEPTPATGDESSEPPGAASDGGSSRSGEPGSATAAPATGVDVSRRKSEVYGERLDSLQGEVEALKDRIFRSKARLAVLKETVLRGVLAGSRVQLAHRNRMGSQFRLVKIVVILDGAQIFAKSDDSGALDAEDEVVIYDANLVPGPHNLTVELQYRGQGYGVFAYLNGYTFDSRSSHSFTAPENGSIKLLSVGYEKGNFTTEMKDRPAVSWQEVGLDAAGRPLPRQRGAAPKGRAKRSDGAASARGRAGAGTGR